MTPEPFDTFRSRVAPDWGKVLDQVIARASAAPGAVLAFDLDSTLLDNRPRQARIVREFGAAHHVPALAACQAAHFQTGWDLREAMKGCGLSTTEAERLYADIRKFWQERFFTSEYCVDDIAVRGAVNFLHRVVATGAFIIYLTGRHEGMRAGTVHAMGRAGLPEPGPKVVLMMKPVISDNDDAFKRIAHDAVLEHGTLVAAFDNEPTHVNDYRSKFPEAMVIHLATDHSGRPVKLLDGVVSIPHFDPA